MSQCVPNWELHESPPSGRLPSHPNTTATPPNISMLEEDYEIAELTWENGQLSMHGLRPTRSISSACKPHFISSSNKYTTTTATTITLDEKQIRAGGTLESIVNQAAQLHPAAAAAIKACPILQGTGQDINVPWFDHHHHQTTTTAATTLDALVPSSNGTNSNADVDNSTLVPRLGASIVGGGWSTTHKSVGGKHVAENNEEVMANYARKRKSTISVAKVPVLVQPQEGSGSRNHHQSVTAGSANSSRNNDSSWHMNNNTLDMTCDVGFTTTTSTSLGCSLPENYYTAKSSGKPSPSSYTTTPVLNNIDDPDCSDSQISRPNHQQREDGGGREEDNKKKQGQSGKSTASTRRSRAAAIHNQSERKRRDKINQKMKTLQKLVPNSSKTDKASMLDEVIEYIKQLQAQVHMANRMSMAATPQMMMAPPAAMTTMQQQLQLFLMMNQMGMGSGMGMRMGMVPDLTAMSSMGHQNHPNIPGVPSFFHPTAAFPAADPLSTFLACQSPNMNASMESYSRMAALFQQLNQTQTPGVLNSKTY